MEYAFDPSTREAEASGLGFHGKFQNQGHKERFCLKINEKKEGRKRKKKRKERKGKENGFEAGLMM